MAKETGFHHTIFTVEKYDADQTRWAHDRLGLPDPVTLTRWHWNQLSIRPYDIQRTEGNLITDAGWNLMMACTAGTPGTLFSATVGRVGVGDGTTSPAYTDTDLSAAAGSGHRQFKLINAAPTVGAGHSDGLVFVSAFGSSSANFHWQEFGTDQGTADGTTVTAVLFNHGLSDMGTKVAGQTWVATETITWS